MVTRVWNLFLATIIARTMLHQRRVGWSFGEQQPARAIFSV